jgi:hypothetical protein
MGNSVKTILGKGKLITDRKILLELEREKERMS